jgi:hypothetical protein
MHYETLPKRFLPSFHSEENKNKKVRKGKLELRCEKKVRNCFCVLSLEKKEKICILAFNRAAQNFPERKQNSKFTKLQTKIETFPFWETCFQSCQQLRISFVQISTIASLESYFRVFEQK